MDRQGPRFRGGPDGRHGDGTNRLSDTEDSVVKRKKSYRDRRQEEDDQEDGDSGGYWEPHPAYDDHDDDDNGRMNSGRRSTRGGPQDRRGVGSHDMDEMSLPPRGAGRDRGNGPPDMDWFWDSMDFGSPGGRGVGKSVSTLKPFDLPTLRKNRAEVEEELRMLNRNGAGKDYHDHNKIITRRIGCIDRIMMIDEDIANLEAGQSESSKMPRGMRPPTHMMDPNPRQSREDLLDRNADEISELKQQRDSLEEILIEYGDPGELKGDRLETARMLDKDLDFTNQAIARLEHEIRAELPDYTLDTSEISGLKWQRDSLKKRLLAIADCGELVGGRYELARRLDKELDDTTQSIARLELEQSQGGKMPRGTGQHLRRRDQEDYDDEESDYEPRRHRRRHTGSAAEYK